MFTQPTYLLIQNKAALVKKHSHLYEIQIYYKYIRVRIYLFSLENIVIMSPYLISQISMTIWESTSQTPVMRYTISTAEMKGERELWASRNAKTQKENKKNNVHLQFIFTYIYWNITLD